MNNVWIKLDIDIPYSRILAEIVRIVKDASLQSLGFRVLSSSAYKSSGGRIHYKALCSPPDDFSDLHIALLQAILGEDPDRYQLNLERVEKQLDLYPYWSWNRLGTRVGKLDDPREMQGCC